MRKTRTLLGLAIMVGLLAVSAVPAAAWFEAAKGTSGHATSGVFELTIGTATLRCESAEVNWSVKLGGTKQQQTKQAQHWGLLLKDITGCEFLGLTLTYNEAFELQINQPSKGEAKNLPAEVLKAGIFKTTGCEIDISTTGNGHLKANSVANSGFNLDANANDENLTEEAKGAACALGGVESGSKAKFKAPTIVAEGVNEV